MRKDEPFVVGHTGKHLLALAVPAAGTSRPILLNEKLTAIDLTDAERNALWAERNAIA